MIVFAHSSYGDTNIYAADTIEHLTSIVEMVGKIYCSWGDDAELDDLTARISKARSLDDYRLAIMASIRPKIGTHESFEAAGFHLIHM